MDCKFQTRKNELEAECKLPTDALATVSNRLTNFMKPFLENYSRSDQQAHAMTVVRGLCSDLERKNGESIAYLFGLDRKAIQYFVGESKWNARPLRDELAHQIGSELGEPDGVLAFDPSSFPKSGKQSVGVARQWCGRLFPHVTRACQGVPLESIETAKHYIEKTETTKGLKVVVRMLEKVYETGRKYAKDFKKTMTIKFDEFLPKWNYTAIPDLKSNREIISGLFP